MRLHTYLALYAGGPGSGCHGDNCGRPEGAGGDALKDKGFEYQGKAGGNAHLYKDTSGNKVFVYDDSVVVYDSTGKLVKSVDYNGTLQPAIIQDALSKDATKNTIATPQQKSVVQPKIEKESKSPGLRTKIKDDEQIKWAVVPGKGISFDLQKPGKYDITEQGARLHADWFKSIGLPDTGPGFDRIRRGYTVVDTKNKIISVRTRSFEHKPEEPEEGMLPPKGFVTSFLKTNPQFKGYKFEELNYGEPINKD